MEIDLEEGLYVFEITLGYKLSGDEHLTTPFVLQADDAEEAEEAAMEYLEELQLADKFWVAEIRGPYDPQEYQRLVDEGDLDRWERLEDYSEEDFLEILESEEL